MTPPKKENEEKRLQRNLNRRKRCARLQEHKRLNTTEKKNNLPAITSSTGFRQLILFSWDLLGVDRHITFYLYCVLFRFLGGTHFHQMEIIKDTAVDRSIRSNTQLYVDNQHGWRELYGAFFFLKI